MAVVPSLWWTKVAKANSTPTSTQCSSKSESQWIQTVLSAKASTSISIPRKLSSAMAAFRNLLSSKYSIWLTFKEHAAAKKKAKMRKSPVNTPASIVTQMMIWITAISMAVSSSFILTGRLWMCASPVAPCSVQDPLVSRRTDQSVLSTWVWSEASCLSWVACSLFTMTSSKRKTTRKSKKAFSDGYWTMKAILRAR